MRYRLRLLALGLLVVALPVMAGIVGFIVGESRGEQPRPQASAAATEAPDFRVLQEIYQILKERYVDPDKVTPDLLRSSAIDGMLKALGDPHTLYIDPESKDSGIDIITGSFEGIGARVEQDPYSGDIVIVAPFTGSPAERAGIRPGDRLLAVDGESTSGWSVAQAVRRIRGPRGTQVRLTVQHRDGTTEEVTIVRDRIVVPTVTSRPVTDSNGRALPDIAYVQIEQITEQTVPDLAQVLRDIKSKGARGLVLDLRINPGGSLNATINIADMFLDNGTILTEVERGGKERSFEARPGGEGTGIPMVVLVGPGSASGAEVLAAALRDNNRAILIGEKTFGKATVNQLHDLSDGGALYVTVARWLTPRGELIEGVGVSPDIQVSTEQEQQGRDLALETAVNHLRQVIAAQTGR
ncbi:Carboxy-terminal processing protease CtpA [bacterium HR24]|nr:Carboxy-terminal processing protease CtpA [bacterium HR24]